MRVASRSLTRPVVFVSGIALLVLAAYGLGRQRREFRPAPRFEGALILIRPDKGALGDPLPDSRC